MEQIFQVKRLRCAYLRARAALHQMAHSTICSGVDVTFARTLQDQSLNEVWEIEWKPPLRRIFPNFNGELWVQYLPGGLAELELHGKYTSSRDAFGLLVEAVAGELFAWQSSRDFLGRIAARIEKRCA